MLYGILLTSCVIISVFLIIIILLQQGKGGLGLGAIGASTQMIFGGSGGQDVFQKATWILGALFMAGSLMLALMKARSAEESTSANRPLYHQEMPAEPAGPVNEPAPANAPAEAAAASENQ